jgi:hypothetical protein
VLDCRIDCNVGVVPRVVVADDPDPNHMPLSLRSYRLRANKRALGGGFLKERAATDSIP